VKTAIKAQYLTHHLSAQVFEKMVENASKLTLKCPNFQNVMKFASRCTRQNANLIVTGFHSFFVRGVDCHWVSNALRRIPPEKLRIMGFKIFEKYQLFKI